MNNILNEMGHSTGAHAQQPFGQHASPDRVFAQIQLLEDQLQQFIRDQFSRYSSANRQNDQESVSNCR